MGYRRKSPQELFWKRWQQTNAELILASGIGSWAFETEASWWEYLQHPDSGLQIGALRQLVLSWPGGPDTLMGDSLGLRTSEIVATPAIDD